MTTNIPQRRLDEWRDELRAEERFLVRQAQANSARRDELARILDSLKGVEGSHGPSR
jgi:hypothetical protein